ncbi:MAG: hypothetical protein K0S04_2840 [Herbinix sp.]|nr:hypothetical protein [Herbinix sp.]
MNGNCNQVITSEEYVDLITDPELQLKGDLNNLELCHIPIDSSFVSAYISQKYMPPNILNAFGYRAFPRIFGLLSTGSLEKTGVTKLRNVPGLGLRGHGVLIGIVDTGIDYTHKAFLRADYTTKILSIWDQTIQSEASPSGYFYGTEYTQSQINQALQHSAPYNLVPTNDEIGHGTFLSGIAMGNVDPYERFSGVVPDAELVMVKLKPAKQFYRNLYLVAEDAICYQENDIMLGVKYLVGIAARYNRPISICIGLGTAQGAHDQNGPLSTYLSSLAQMNGIAVTVAAGNEGNTRRHFESIMQSGTNEETIQLNVGPNEKGFVLEIWGDSPDIYAVGLLTPSGEYIPPIYPRLKEQRTLSFIYEPTIVEIMFQLLGSRSGAQLVLLRFDKPTVGIWSILIKKISGGLDFHYNMWLPSGQFIGPDSYFLMSSPFTTLVSPANSNLTIIATAYDIVNNSLLLSASRGFTRTNQFAPSFAAPGVNILGPAPGNTYTTMSGTSVAAAHTAGVAAMLFEWGKTLGAISYMNGTDIKNLLIRGAQRTPGDVYPNREWGYGQLDIYHTFDILRGTIR